MRYQLVRCERSLLYPASFCHIFIWLQSPVVCCLWLMTVGDGCWEFDVCV